MYRSKGSLWGGGRSIDLHGRGGGGIVEYLPLLYLFVGCHGYRGIGVTVPTVVVVAAVVMVALAALRRCVGLGVVGRARVLGGGCGGHGGGGGGGLSAGGHGDGDRGG
jgi:hypothetical protein